MAEIFDLRTRNGQAAYLSHCHREAENKEPHEIEMMAAVAELQAQATNLATQWLDANANLADVHASDTLDTVNRMAVQMLYEAAQTHLAKVEKMRQFIQDHLK